MKPLLSRTVKHPSVSQPAAAESSPSLRDELVAAIRAAFEVAVEMAAMEVMKLVGQATGGVREEMRRENESLKRRLWRAEGMLRSARTEEEEEEEEEEGGGSARTSRRPDVATRTDEPAHQKFGQKSQNPIVEKVHDCAGRRGDGHRSDQPPDRHRKEVNEEVSPVCVARVESATQPRRDDNLPPFPSEDDDSAVVQVSVKQEKPEEDRDVSASCLDSIKDERFNSEGVSAAQSEMLVEWTPEALDIRSQESVGPLLFSRLAQAHPPNLIASLSLATDLPSLSSELPETPPQGPDGNLRTSRNLSPTYTCKYCGQTFQLPSLLRRHYSQCQQKCYHQPVAGSRRTKLQLYPPGFSPFRCTVCNREFNRMENLKTHLRIHTGEMPYTCQVCSKCFRHSGALTRHFRIHTGEMPYICGQCGKSFRNCGGLKFHQRSHSMQPQ